MFSNTLSFLSSLNVSDQVSHPYKTTGKIIVLYILILKFLDSNLEDKEREITYCYFNISIIFKGQICYTEMELPLEDGSAVMVPFIGHQDLET